MTTLSIVDQRKINRNPELLSNKDFYNILQVINSEKQIKNRVERLFQLGYYVDTLPMGSGGVGQVKNMRDGSIRVQIGCGHGRGNYAKCVVL